jgi:hypothetical protein
MLILIFKFNIIMNIIKFILLTSIIMFFLFSSLLISACQNNNQVVKPDLSTTQIQKFSEISALPEGYDWYTNSEYYFKLAYPISWSIVSSAGYSAPIPPIVKTILIQMNQNMADGTIMINIMTEYDLAGAIEKGATKQNKNGVEYYFMQVNNFAATDQQIAIYSISNKWVLVQCFASHENYPKCTEIFNNSLDSFTIIK